MSIKTAFHHPATQDLSRSQRAAMGETLLLRFLVQHGILPGGLLKAANAERLGSGSSLSLLDWLVHRGHISERALTFAMAHCLRLAPGEAPPPQAAPKIAAPIQALSRKVALGQRRRRTPLRLIQGHLRHGGSLAASSTCPGRPIRSRLRLLPRRPA